MFNATFNYILHLVSVAVTELLLDVHGEHLAAEREALSLLDDLLVQGHGVVAHHHMTLQMPTTV